MKLHKICALLAALLLLTGCGAIPSTDPASPPQAATPEPSAAEPAEPSSADSTTAAPETDAPTETEDPVKEDWEEEWPEEYPVTNYRLEDGAITQHGELNQYRYTQLPAAESYVDLLTDTAHAALGDETLPFEMDSPHDGYANWFMRSETGSASVSGSSITGRFCYSVYPGFDRVLPMSETTITDRSGMEQAARDFAARFAQITGALELVSAADEPCHYNDLRSDELRDITVPTVVYTFRSAQQSGTLLEIQPGDPVPVTCGDSTLADLSVPCFTVTVWPDGTVVAANNYITKADAVADGTTRMPDESDMPMLLTYLSSFTENDTVVITSIRACSFSVYFGSADIEPTLTVEYYFESDPDNRQSTELVLPGDTAVCHPGRADCNRPFLTRVCGQAVFRMSARRSGIQKKPTANARGA